MTRKRPRRRLGGVFGCMASMHQWFTWMVLGRAPFPRTLGGPEAVARPPSAALAGRPAASITRGVTTPDSSHSLLEAWLQALLQPRRPIRSARMGRCEEADRRAVELPGVEPGSRGPDAVGSTCVGSG